MPEAKPAGSTVIAKTATTTERILSDGTRTRVTEGSFSTRREFKWQKGVISTCTGNPRGVHNMIMSKS